MRHDWILLALLLVLAGVAAPAKAQAVHRCMAADGGSYYTDRDCGDVASSEKQSAAPAAQAAVAPSRGPGCARTPEDLVMGVRTALEARSGNRLAAYYDWQGMSSGGGYGVLDRLNLLSRDVLLDLHLAPGPTAAGKPAPLPQQMLVEQAPADGNGRTHVTTFALVVHAGCWWLRF